MQFGNHDGTITDHDGNHFKSLLLDTYKEANIDPATVDFIEAYGSGIKVILTKSVYQYLTFYFNLALI